MTPLIHQGDSHWTRWCFETCLLFGCEPAIAARVTAIFADALEER